MNLSIQRQSANRYSVRTAWTTYTLDFGITEVLITAPGFDTEKSILFFPDQADPVAISAYLIIQLEKESQ